jgi:hypothetical protein
MDLHQLLHLEPTRLLLLRKLFVVPGIIINFDNKRSAAITLR